MCNGNKVYYRDFSKAKGIAAKPYFNGKKKAGTFQILLSLHNVLPVFMSECCYTLTAHPFGSLFLPLIWPLL